MLRFLFKALPVKLSLNLFAASSAFFAGSYLAWHHPIWPSAALIVFWFWCAIVAWWPAAWLFMVPACLPFLNFSPWTGWLIFEEFDLLLLGALAGGYGREILFCSSRNDAGVRRPLNFYVLVALLGALNLISLYRGFLDAGGFLFNWYAAYTNPLNSFRVFKSVGFILLFIPLMQRTIAQSRGFADRQFATGIVAGLTIVTLAVIWERAAFPGLFDFSKRYRTVALFWEMHVGGGAIDAYLAMSTPFVVWALVSARRPAVWASAAILALLTGYACLTTFSRGVYFATAGSLILLGLLLWAQKFDFSPRKFISQVLQHHRLKGWRPKAGLVLVVALFIEVVGVLGGGSYMTERLATSDGDFTGRVKHWQRGLQLLDGPTDWFLGKGLGRFPANYAARAPQGEFSGAVTLHQEFTQGGSTNSFVTVQGPASRRNLGGLFALTQRTAKVSEGRYSVNLNVRVQHEADVYIELCERHLLYDGNCRVGFIRVFPVTSQWQDLTVSLHGSDSMTSATYSWSLPRLTMLSLSIVNSQGVADFNKITLTGPQHRQLLKNEGFLQGLAHWSPAAQFYFVPWHSDSLFLEVLVEQGVGALVVFALLIVSVFWRLVIGNGRYLSLSPYLAASLGGALLVGVVSSFMDVARVAFLYYLLTFYALMLTQQSKIR